MGLGGLVLACATTAQATEPSVTAVTAVSHQQSSPADGLARRHDVQVHPYAAIAGGMHFEQLTSSNDQKTPEDVVNTPAVSRLGLRGDVGSHVSFESEMEFNLGISSKASQHGPHGSSVWEGMAAISVRNQWVRYKQWGWQAAVGIITDPGSVDFLSSHAFDLLLTDHLSRDPLILTGFNRGQGVFTSYDMAEGLGGDLGPYLDKLELGFALTAGNPTSMTGTAAMGGAWGPYTRFYHVAARPVGDSVNHSPADGYHTLIAAPSLQYDSKYFEARGELQIFRANTNTGGTLDKTLSGKNIRGGIKAKLPVWKLLISPFGNYSKVDNDLLDPNDSGTLSDERWEASTFSAGLDVNHRTHKSGMGAWFTQGKGRQGSGGETKERWLNVAGTYYLNPNTSLGARVGRYSFEYADQEETNTSYYLTMKVWL